jgi:hypothetical protein
VNTTQFPQDVVDFFANKDEEETLVIQMRMAERLTEKLRELESLDELTAMNLLDTLGVCGMSLTIGHTASKCFFANLILDNEGGE